MPLKPSDITPLSAPRLGFHPVAADEPDPPHQGCIEELLGYTGLKAVNVVV